MDSKGLVSILIPAYKVEKYISASISSAQAQSYPDIEIVIVNDGSPDRTGEICDEFAQKDKRIRVIHLPKSGVSIARNTALEAAKGDYVFFLDSDDRIEPDTISYLMECMHRDGSDIACCNFLKVDEEGNPLDTLAGFVDDLLTPEQFLVQAYEDRFYAVSSIVACKLYKRSTIGALRFPAERQHEDEALSYQIVNNAQSITTVSAQKYYYLQRADSIMGNKTSVKSLDVVEAYLQKAEWYRDKGNNYLMYRALRQSCGTLAKKKQLLDMKDETVRRRYSELKRRFFCILLRDGIGRVPVACFAAGGVFLVSEKLLLRISGKS